MLGIWIHLLAFVAVRLCNRGVCTIVAFAVGEGVAPTRLVCGRAREPMIPTEETPA